MGISWLDIPFAFLIGVSMFYGYRTGLSKALLQVVGAVLGLSIGRWVALMVFAATGWLGIPAEFLTAVACLGAAIVGSFLTNLLAWKWAPFLAAWAPRSDRVGGVVIGAFVGALLWGTLYMGLLGWAWQPWTRAAQSSMSGILALHSMPSVYAAIDRVFPGKTTPELNVLNTKP